MDAPLGTAFWFDTLVERSPTGVYVIEHGRLVYANPRMATMFGYELPELLALPSVLSLVAPGDRERVREMIRRRFAGEVDEVRYTWRGIRKDGATIDLETLARRAELSGRVVVGGTIVDITEQRRYEQDLAEREARLRALIETTPDVVFTCTFGGRITSMNPAGERLAGWSDPGAAGHDLTELAGPHDAELVRERLGRAREGQSGTFEMRIGTGDRDTTLELTLGTVRRDDVPVEVMGVGRDVTARKQKEEALRNLTLEDELTGVYNRRGLLTLAERHLKLAVRKKSRVFLLYCDVDGLKQINDTYGHQAGDAALVAAAAVLRQTFRSADIIARLGGDEFTVFPLEAADASGALLLARLEAALDAYNASGAHPFRLTMSAGIARFEPDRTLTMQQLLDEADRCLYQQKRRNNNK